MAQIRSKPFGVTKEGAAGVCILAGELSRSD